MITQYYKGCGNRNSNKNLNSEKMSQILYLRNLPSSFLALQQVSHFKTCLATSHLSANKNRHISHNRGLSDFFENCNLKNKCFQSDWIPLQNVFWRAINHVKHISSSIQIRQHVSTGTKYLNLLHDCVSNGAQQKFSNIFFRVYAATSISAPGKSDSNSTPTDSKIVEDSAKKGVNELKSRIKDVIKQYKWFGYDDYLMRWLKHHKSNVEQTELAIREALTWRKDNDIETLANNDLRSIYPELAEELQVDFIAGWSRNGQPIVTMNYDGIQLHYLIKKYGKETCRRYMIQLTARVDKYMQTQSSKTTGAIIVVNFKDVSFLNSSAAESISLVLEVTKTNFKYFPNLIDAMYFIHVGWFARVLFKLLTPILTANVATVKVLGSDREEWERVIFDVIDPNQLSPQFGGSNIKTGKSESKV